MARTQGTGRKKIEIRKIENKMHLKTTFTKRRKGLFKKVADCCASSGNKAAVFTFSPYGRPYAFGWPSTSEVIGDFYAAVGVGDDNGKSSAAEDPNSGDLGPDQGGGELWWKKPAADVEDCDVEEFKDSLTEFKKLLIWRIEEFQRRNRALLNLFD